MTIVSVCSEAQACSAHFLAGLASLSPVLHPALCARTHVINVISARGPARAEPCAALVTAAAQVNTRGTQVTNQRAAESQVTNQRPAFPAAAPVASPPVTRSRVATAWTMLVPELMYSGCQLLMSVETL